MRGRGEGKGETRRFLYAIVDCASPVEVLKGGRLLLLFVLSRG